LHDCDNRACVRPNHLFLGTHADNMADAKRKGRSGRPKAKLSPNDVRGIREALGKTQKQIAADFGCSQSTVSLVRRHLRH
jgi:DNA-binding transcriptional regulator YiaG